MCMGACGVCGVLGEWVGHYKNDVAAERGGGLARETKKKKKKTPVCEKREQKHRSKLKSQVARRAKTSSLSPIWTT